MIISLLNEGKVVEALQQAGLKTSELTDGPGFKVFCEFETKRGKYRAELPLDEHVTEMIMEALPVSYVVVAAKSIAEGIASQLPAMLDAQDDNP